MSDPLLKEIDPGRSSIGKGLLWSTGSFGCEREAWYGETVRDEKGWRLRHPQSERVHFGKAIDILHATLTKRRLEGDRIGSLVDVGSAIDIAYHAGLFGEWDEEPDRETFLVQITNAAQLLVGSSPGPKEQEAGTPLHWMPLDGIHIQGMDGVSLEVPDMFGDRPLGGTPDYVWTHEGVMIGWLDVKATKRAHSYPAKWLGAEAAIYTYLLMRLNDGVLPSWAGYLEYRRNAKPYWHQEVVRLDREPHIIRRQVSLAEAYINRWRKALDAGDPDLLSFSPTECADCPFRGPIEGVGFAGCPIGQSIVGEEGAIP